MKLLLKLNIFFLFLFFEKNAFSQIPYKLVDGRENKYCEACLQVISNMPKEVQFGIQINANGDVYFSMSNKVWFDKIFKNKSYGISIDLVAKDRYVCGNAPVPGLPMGTMLPPIYKNELVETMEEVSQAGIFVKIGKVPAKIMNKQLEGNLVILNGNYVCYYTNFMNIDRSVWQLLPMGLFTDSLINTNSNEDSNVKKDFFTYSKKLQLEIPFEKSSAGFSSVYLKKLYDSLDLTKYNIRKTDIRVYSSIEGPLKTNLELMKRRADTIVKVLKNYEPSLSRIKILSAENWLEFFRDIEQTENNDLKDFSKQEIKQKLTDVFLLKSIEPLLSKHRKAILTIFLEPKSSASNIANNAVMSGFSNAISNKNILGAKAIQKELVERILDNKIPITYINQLEVPKSKEFSSLLNDKEVYKYLLRATNEYEALDNFLALQKLDPTNGRINYNICALRFFMWQHGNDTSSKKILLKEINELGTQGVNNNLVKRMLINYQILTCDDRMQKQDYAGKDNALTIIRTIYTDVELNDEDIYSIAKYYAFYAHNDWSMEIILPRIDKLAVSEDLIFYYVNLLFFNAGNFNTGAFEKATLNATTLNKKRFCNFFLPNDKGGASMQLLENAEIKTLYCEACKN